MAYAYVHDVASTWTRYEDASAGLVVPAPRGLIAHLAGPTGDGVRIIDIWETEEAGEAFRVDRLAPALAALGEIALAHCVFRDLRPEQVVLLRGAHLSTATSPSSARLDIQEEP